MFDQKKKATYNACDQRFPSQNLFIWSLCNNKTFSTFDLRHFLTVKLSKTKLSSFSFTIRLIVIWEEFGSGSNLTLDMEPVDANSNKITQKISSIENQTRNTIKPILSNKNKPITQCTFDKNLFI